MSRICLIVVLFLVVTGIVCAQGGLVVPQSVHQPAGSKVLTIDPHGRTVQQSRYGSVIWNNDAVSAWWSGVTPGYLNLDWGTIGDTNQLPHEVVDGFKFKYGTNNMDPAGESMAVYHFDSTTGFGNLGVQESGFLFTGLPNGYGLPTLPPGYGWIWSIVVDLEASGYEYILNSEIGVALSLLSTPTMGSSGMVLGLPAGFGGNGATGTQDAFDIYYPNGAYNGTFFFGGYPFWATWSGQLYGAQDPATGMTYFGIGATGNTAYTYTVGSWTGARAAVQWIQKTDPITGQTEDVLVADTSSSSQYYPQFDLTLFIRPPYNNAFPMAWDLVGNFQRLTLNIPPQYQGVTVYWQGIISQYFFGGPVLPADASNGVRAN